MKFSKILQTGIIISSLIFSVGCKDNSHKTAETISLNDYKKEKKESGNAEPITVISRGMNFELPKKIKSGWQTFRYENRSGDTHFFILEKLPPGKSLQDSEKEIIPVFVDAMNLINSGNMEQGLKKFEELPEWFFNIKFLGGAGLISPGETAQTTLNLSPGNYLIECYVKMPDGTFHSAMGMLEEIEVLPVKTKMQEPKAENTINISTENGIVLTRTPASGKQRFQVNFLDQKAYENFVGHDVNLVRYKSEKDLKALNEWLNWLAVDSFKSPTPENLEFLGGVQDLPAGETAYFTATLAPGNYALVAEIPDPASRKMLTTFVIEEKDLASE